MDVIGFGLAGMDLMIRLDHMPGPNQGAKTLDSSWQYGGKVATAMAAVARLGFTGGMAGPIGGMIGRYVKADFERYGLDTAYLIDDGSGETPLWMCLADASTGGRSLLTASCTVSPRMPLPDALDRAYMTSGKYLLISGGDAGSAAAARWCNEAGVPVVIDADSYAEATHALLPCVDHFIPSEFYYQQLFGGDRDYEKNLRALRRLQENPAAVAVVTLGERGLAGVDDRGHYFEQPAFSVPVADTTGAGDVFHGAYIAGLLTGRSVRDACRFASATSAIKCTRLGGRAGIPTRPVVERFLRDGTIDYAEIDERVAAFRALPFKA